MVRYSELEQKDPVDKQRIHELILVPPTCEALYHLSSFPGPKLNLPVNTFHTIFLLQAFLSFVDKSLHGRYTLEVEVSSYVGQTSMLADQFLLTIQVEVIYFFVICSYSHMHATCFQVLLQKTKIVNINRVCEIKNVPQRFYAFVNQNIRAKQVVDVQNQ